MNEARHRRSLLPGSGTPPVPAAAPRSARPRGWAGAQLSGGCLWPERPGRHPGIFPKAPPPAGCGQGLRLVCSDLGDRKFQKLEATTMEDPAITVRVRVAQVQTMRPAPPVPLRRGCPKTSSAPMPYALSQVQSPLFSAVAWALGVVWCGRDGFIQVRARLAAHVVGCPGPISSCPAGIHRVARSRPSAAWVG